MKKEVQLIIVKVFKKWLLPDFTNKLTWLVATSGIAIMIAPNDLKITILNFIIHNINGLLQESFHTLQTESPVEPKWGFFLVLISLLHNGFYKYCSLKHDFLENEIKKERRYKDIDLMKEFIKSLPSNSNTVLFLKDHDFANTFPIRKLELLKEFNYDWNNAEYEFVNPELNEILKRFKTHTETFFAKLNPNIGVRFSGSEDGELYMSVIKNTIDPEYQEIPKKTQEIINELNDMATKLYEVHQELINYAKTKL